MGSSNVSCGSMRRSRVPSQQPVQVLLGALLLGVGVLRAVLGVVVTQDGHHVVVAKVNRLVHRRVPPPAGEGAVSAAFRDRSC